MMFSPSLVAKRQPMSSGGALINRANWPRTSSVLASISSRGIGFSSFRRKKAWPASATGIGDGVM